jgi:hypothetical protein
LWLEMVFIFILPGCFICSAKKNPCNRFKCNYKLYQGVWAKGNSSEYMVTLIDCA